MRVDVAIVGASAAGLAATIAAARSGARVVLLESRPQVGAPAPPAIVAFDFLWPRHVPATEASVFRRLDGALLRGRSGRGPFVAAPLALHDRARLDERLAREAINAGAQIQTSVRDLAARADGVLAHASGDVEADVIVFADGARSLSAPFVHGTRHPSRLTWGAILDVRAPGDDPHLTLTFGAHAPGGRSQLTPLGDNRWRHWTFFHGDPGAAEAIARAALAIDARLQGWKDPEATYLGVGPDPVYTVPGELVGYAPRARADGRRAGILVAGGAAGQGGLEVGLASGWMAGEAAARVVQGNGKLRDYESAWRDRYQRGYRRLSGLADAVARLSDAEIDAVLSAWADARLPPTPTARTFLSRPRGAAALAWAAWLAWARA